MPTVGLQRVLRHRFVSVTNIVVFRQAAVRVTGLVLFWPWPPSASMPTVGLERVLRHRFVSVTNILVFVMLRHVRQEVLQNAS